MSTEYDQTHDARLPVSRRSEQTDSADASVRRPPLVYVLLGIMLFQGASGIAGGIGLLMDPTGATLGIPQTWLTGSPFQDYLIPGIVLLTLLGIFPLVAFYGLLLGKQWGLIASLAVGLVLLVWLVVEILTIGYQAQPPLQAIYAVVAVAILFVALAPSVRRYYGVGTSAS